MPKVVSQNKLFKQIIINHRHNFEAFNKLEAKQSQYKKKNDQKITRDLVFDTKFEEKEK